MRYLNIAKIYNAKTGASMTHEEVADWGLVESLNIISALEFMDQV